MQPIPMQTSAPNQTRVKYDQFGRVIQSSPSKPIQPELKYDQFGRPLKPAAVLKSPYT